MKYEEKLLIIIFVVGMIVLSGCTTKISNNENVCGDGICTLIEDCNTCIEDCSCEEGESCTPSGICRSSVCGDEFCSELERSSDSCCEDCGCEEGSLCNKINQKCQLKLVVNEDKIKQAVYEYLTENELEGKIIDISDEYYQEQSIKQVRVDCSKEDIPYPCGLILFVDEEGKIIKGMRTS